MRELAQARAVARHRAAGTVVCLLAALPSGLRAQAVPPGGAGDPTQVPVTQAQAIPSAGTQSPASGAQAPAVRVDEPPPKVIRPGAAPGAAPGASTSRAADKPLPETRGLCTLEGTVRGSDGGIVPSASLTLLGEGKIREKTTRADDDGDYLMDDVPCGQFVLAVTMPGFAPLAIGGEMLDAGEVLQQDVVLKISGVNASVNVVATQTEIAQAQVDLQEHQRMLGAFPNFFVSYQWSAVPLHARQKFGLAWHTAIDPANLVLAGVVAGIQQANNSLPGYGQGAVGYASRFGGNFGNEVTGTYLGGAILPTIFRQDPRYFYRGTGTRPSRLWYAVSRAFVTRGDNGRDQVNFSGMLGDLGSGALSNLFVTSRDRSGASLTIENGLVSIAGDCINNTLQEFVLRKVTTKTRGRRGQATDGTTAP